MPTKICDECKGKGGICPRCGGSGRVWGQRQITKEEVKQARAPIKQVFWVILEESEDDSNIPNTIYLSSDKAIRAIDEGRDSAHEEGFQEKPSTRAKDQVWEEERDGSLTWMDEEADIQYTLIPTTLG